MVEIDKSGLVARFGTFVNGNWEPDPGKYELDCLKVKMCTLLASDECVSSTDLCEYLQISTTLTDQVLKLRPEEARRILGPPRPRVGSVGHSGRARYSPPRPTSSLQ